MGAAHVVLNATQWYVLAALSPCEIIVDSPYYAFRFGGPQRVANAKLEPCFHTAAVES